ncbi:MAG: type II CAAX endopeptidase family protein [Kofleriaceae bacterium]
MRLLRLAGRALKAVSLDQWRAIDSETDRGAGTAAGNFSVVVLVVLVTTAISLTLQEYLGGRDTYTRWLSPALGRADRYWELKSFAWWSAWRVAGYMLLPMLVILCLPGQRLRDYYISPRGFFRHLWIYVLMFAAVFPFVYAASRTPEFRHTYPFYRLANRSAFDFWAWQALYAAQFLSLEFFFRGFLLQGLRRALGSNAVFVMIVPYCMIHYGKPLPETLGAIGAGLILGTLAMRTRSIWGGVLIHVAVAVSMDVMALQGCPPSSAGISCGP